jgi:uncharacterized membrane protein
VRRGSQASLTFFAIGLTGLGVIALAYGGFAEEWQLVGAWVPDPARTGLACATGVVMALGGLGLLFERTATLSIRVLFPFLVSGFLLQLPAGLKAPLVEVNWESVGELATILSAGWVLFAARSALREGSSLAFAAGENGLRIGRILFGLALLPIGLSHFVYATYTATLVPAWLPFRTGWVYLTGAGHTAAGLGALFGVVPRLAAAMEAGMLGVFTLLVWAPKIVTPPTSRATWTEFAVSWTMAAAAWVVADSIVTRRATTTH